MMPASPLANSQPSPIEEREVHSRTTAFHEAHQEAIDLSAVLVANDEAIGINPQTLEFASQTLLPLVVSLALAPPLILPLQNGGIGAEWHSAGMNIELRFRRPFDVYAMIEDSQGVTPTCHGRDPDLKRAQLALRELSCRAC